MVRTNKKKSKQPEASQKEEAKDRDNVVFFFRPQQNIKRQGEKRKQDDVGVTVSPLTRLYTQSMKI